MMQKALSSIEEAPYCFSGPSIKFQGHTDWKIDDLNPIWVRLLGRSQLSNPSDLPCFNSIPIPLFSIPIPLLTISFNYNSHSGHFNSNSGEFKSNPNSWNDLLMSSSKLIMIMITRYMYIKLLLLVPSVSYPLLNGYKYMALVDPINSFVGDLEPEWV